MPRGDLFDERARDGQGDATVTLEGVVERITYRNPANQFTVVKLAVEGRPARDPLAVKGFFPEIAPGERIRVTGRYAVDPRYGEGFRADAVLSLPPETRAGIERYLGSGLIKGIGPHFAARIVKHFGERALEVIETAPDRLREVRGLGRKRAAALVASLAQQAAVRRVYVFLQGHGVGLGQASRIYKAFGEKAVDLVREDPYRLSRDVWGIGFRTADAIARSLGIPEDSPRRAQAGLRHVLAEATEDGHVAFPAEQLVEKARSGLAIPPPVLEPALEACVRGGEVIREDVPARGAFLYMPDLHCAERTAAARVRALARAPGRVPRFDVERAIAWAQEKTRLDLSPEQRSAIRAAVAGGVVVVTGGPGTGKTTFVRALLRILEVKRQVRVALAAPTGRAAKRLEEATGREASTIHRLLKWNPRTQAFERGAASPLDVDVLVLDETSMLDVPLLASVVLAVTDGTTLVLIGDRDQLPSVGPGSVLADLIRSGIARTVTLSHVFRQATRSRIVEAAHRINGGDAPDLSSPAQGESDAAARDFYFMEAEEPARALAAIVRLVKERIPARFGLDPVRDVQVLTPMRKGVCGAKGLNEALQQALNPAGAAGPRATRGFAPGDKVMQVRNDYDREVWNGDTGAVAALSPEDGSVRVRFEGREVEYPVADQDELALAYAVTVHKSQGSEYPAVVVPVLTEHYIMLQRNLLYTAVTRGRKLVVLVGSRRAVHIAVSNDRVRERHGFLAERLRGEMRE